MDPSLRYGIKATQVTSKARARDRLYDFIGKRGLLRRSSSKVTLRAYVSHLEDTPVPNASSELRAT